MSLGATASGAPDGGGAQTGGRGQSVNVESCVLLPPTPPPFAVCACSLFEVLLCLFAGADGRMRGVRTGGAHDYEVDCPSPSMPLIYVSRSSARCVLWHLLC